MCNRNIRPSLDENEMGCAGVGKHANSREVSSGSNIAANSDGDEGRRTSPSVFSVVGKVCGGVEIMGDCGEKDEFPVSGGFVSRSYSSCLPTSFPFPHT